MKRTLLLSFVIFALVKTNIAQNVNIPDANFKAYLVGNSEINTNSDSEIQTTEATAFNGYINCKDLSITNLTGIEAFTGLKELNCSGNSITSLDVAKLVNLEYLECSSNILTNLDVSNNINIAILRCHENNITSLDVTKNTELLVLRCYSNKLTSLDISKNTKLLTLMCHSNALTSLDVSNNINIAILRCHENNITSLDVSKNLGLDNFYCHTNSLASLDISKNTKLYEVYCQSNAITSLDITNNTRLEVLYCYANTLTSLNLANGNNSKLTLLKAKSNPNLTCIQVDDTAYSNSNWTDKDSAAIYSLNCPGGGMSVENFSSPKRILYPNPAKTQVHIGLISEEISCLIVLDATGKVHTPVLKGNVLTVSHLPSGLYIIKVKSKDHQEYTAKLMVK